MTSDEVRTLLRHLEDSLAQGSSNATWDAYKELREAVEFLLNERHELHVKLIAWGAR